MLRSESEDSESWDEVLSNIFPGFKMPDFSNSGKGKWYRQADEAFRTNLTSSPRTGFNGQMNNDES